MNAVDNLFLVQVLLEWTYKNDIWTELQKGEGANKDNNGDHC